MNILKDTDGKLVIAGLGALAVLGSFIVAFIAFGIMEAAGMNDGLAVALCFVVWAAVVAVSIFGLVSFYSKSSSNNRVEQVTVIREVIVPVPVMPEIQAVEPMPRPFLDEPSHPVTPSANYRAMLLEGNEQVEPETPRFPNDPESSKPLN